MLQFPGIVFLEVDPECQLNSYQLAHALRKRLQREGAITANFDTPVRYLVQKILAPLLRPETPSPVRPQDEVALHWNEPIPGRSYSPDEVCRGMLKSLPADLLAALLVTHLDEIVLMSAAGDLVSGRTNAFILDSTPELAREALISKSSALDPDDCLYIELRATGDAPTPVRLPLPCRQALVRIPPGSDPDVAVTSIVNFHPGN